MIQVSRRYVPHVAVLFALAAAISWVHSGEGFRVEDCADPAALFPTNTDPLEGDPREPERRRMTFDEAVGEDGRWVEGSVDGAGGIRLGFFVLRSYEARRLFHRPARNLAGRERSSQEVLELVGDGSDPLPIHRVRYEGSSSGGREVVAAYLLVYQARPVANAYLTNLLSAPVQLVTGRKPTTLYLAFARVPPAQNAQAEEATRQWLAERWANHRAACQPAAAPAGSGS